MTTTNKWLKLSGQYILFGPGGITRIEQRDGFNAQTQKPEQYTVLYCGALRTTDVSEPANEIIDSLELE